jgi:hypothetical protein
MPALVLVPEGWYVKEFIQEKGLWVTKEDSKAYDTGNKESITCNKLGFAMFMYKNVKNLNIDSLLRKEFDRFESEGFVPASSQNKYEKTRMKGIKLYSFTWLCKEEVPSTIIMRIFRKSFNVLTFVYTIMVVEASSKSSSSIGDAMSTL